MPQTITKETILKYDIPGPRYTSYPTAPNWSSEVNADLYIKKLKTFGTTNKTLSVYIHLPFCETMCTYCACNVVIRKQDEKYAEEYLKYLFKEIDLVTSYFGRKIPVKQFHLGGGTPTYLNRDQLERLVVKVGEKFQIDPNGEIAIEIDPRTVDQKKIEKLKTLGFNRISMGVQDFDERVQKAVNRIQPFELVKDYYDLCRELGFPSINFDLIYGLPYQTQTSFQMTVKKIITLKPDRIALYSFAYVPWLKKHQSKIEQEALPTNDMKLDIFLNARDEFLASGYQVIAMDHFALANDELAKAFIAGALYRNFMGYTVKPADEYLGLGLTSIGFLENTFIQNHKTIGDYYQLLDLNRLPVERGKVLSEDDQIRQWTINSFMCQFRADKRKFQKIFDAAFDVYFKQEQEHIKSCEEGGLIEVTPEVIAITDLGKIFVRNICMGFDFYLRQSQTPRQFSRTI